MTSAVILAPRAHILHFAFRSPYVRIHVYMQIGSVPYPGYGYGIRPFSEYMEHWYSHVLSHLRLLTGLAYLHCLLFSS